jgi:hypothetical protein
MSDLLRAIRWLLRRPQPVVRRQRAIEIACEEYDHRGWDYDRPEALERLNVWVVQMYRDAVRGPVVVINQQTGNVENRGPRTQGVGKKIRSELRRASKDAAKAGGPTDFVTFDPSAPRGTSKLPEQGSIVAELRNRAGERLLFTEDRLYVEDLGSFFEIRYRDIADFHYMKTDNDQGEEPDLESRVGERIILEDFGGQSFELRELGYGFDAIWNFLGWLLRGRVPYRREQLPSA